MGKAEQKKIKKLQEKYLLRLIRYESQLEELESVILSVR